MLPVGDQPLASQQIPCNVFPDKLVVRKVLIESADHIVAVAPRIRLVGIELVSHRLAEPHQVQPVASPFLAVVRGGQQPFHDGPIRRR